MQHSDNRPAADLPSGDCADLMEQPLGIHSMELRVVRLEQHEDFRSAIGMRSQRQALLVRLHARDGSFGIAECSGRPDPYYNEEFLSGSLQLLREFIAPLLDGSTSLAGLQRALSRIRGWNFTRAAVLDAAFDLQRRRGIPDLLDRLPGERLEKVPAGISLGIFADPESARKRINTAVSQGYRRIKLKLSPGMDRTVLEAALQESAGREVSLDANGSFGEDAMEQLVEFANCVAMVEQPFAPDRLDLHAALRCRLEGTRVCLDESIHSPGSLESALAIGALDELNLKPGRVGGQAAAVSLLERCRTLSLHCWVGGMFETGIGRLANLRYAALLPDATAHDMGPSSRYFRQDILQHPVLMDADGLIDTGEGHPAVLDEQAIERFTEHTEMLEAGQ
ncbi:hypothetical protein KDL29_11375 [bacterium]|nr:hypothetical protein [bacterium]